MLILQLRYAVEIENFGAWKIVCIILKIVHNCKLPILQIAQMH